jgi:hypothetical protein
VVRLPCHTPQIPCVFRRDVISKCLEGKSNCPHCGHMYSFHGSQPTGVMTVARNPSLRSVHAIGRWPRREVLTPAAGGRTPRCETFEYTGTWIIRYRFDNGVQNCRHPNPGVRYSSTQR